MTNWTSLHGSFFRDCQVLITGGAGFIGSHLATALNTLGAQVTVLDDLSNSIDNAQKILGPAKLVVGSILEQDLVTECASGKKFVFHLAALGSVPRSVKEPRAYHDVDATGTLNVLEAARAASVKRVMYSASSSAYGDAPTSPKVETMPAMPLSPYAAAKAAGEMYMGAYAASYGLETVCLRYFNIFGPRQSATSAYAAVIAAFATALLNGKHPIIYGDGSQSRDFTYVDNAVHANLLGARCERPMHGEVINIACGRALNVNDLAAAMARHLKRPDLTPIHESARVGDILHSLADLGKAETILGYRPIVGLEPGLAATLDWYASTMR